MADSNVYSFLDVNVTINRQQVLGFFEGDDCVMVTPGADVGTLLVGADGSSLFSQSANNSAEIRLRLQHSSPTNRLLMQLLQQQKDGALGGFGISVIDRRSNEGGASARAFISIKATDQKGVNASFREWTIIAGDYKDLIPFGSTSATISAQPPV